jgi:flagellar biosynthetic protein FliR
MNFPLFDLDARWGELLSFFAVLVRYSVLVAVLPIVGDRFVPVMVKVLLALAFSLALFPSLVARGLIVPVDALTWGSSAGGIAGTMGAEVLFGLVLGYVGRLTFDAVSFGGNLVGSFMGLSIASTYDPHQESQTQVAAEVQLAIATLAFLAMDGHHWMLQAALDSFKVIGIGGLLHAPGNGFSQHFVDVLIRLTTQVLTIGLQLSAPVAVTLFGVNVAFGVMSKAMPQLNILVLSFAASALVGLAVMFLTVPEFVESSGGALSRVGDWMGGAMNALAGR